MIYITLIIIFLSVLSGWFILWKVPLIHLNHRKDLKSKKLSIIIPARNEEKNLPILLKSLQNQHLQPDEILVVDDDSEDKTVEIAKKYGARVVQFPTGESDWVGKSAACFYGAKEATGDCFFFLDADIFLPEPSSLGRILAEFQEEKGPNVLSIQPYHMVEKLYEHLSVVFNLLVLAGMNRFSVLEEKLQPAGAFGPSLLVDRNTYFRVGGHKRARGSIMENIDLGKIFLEDDVPVHLYGGKGSLHFRMYPEGYSSLAEGWSKSFVSGSKATHPLILFGTILWISGAFISPLFAVYGSIQGDLLVMILSALGYLLYYVQFLRMTAIAGNFRPWVMLFYPLFFVYFILLFTWSAIKTKIFKRVSWKGREITLKEEENGE